MGAIRFEDRFCEVLRGTALAERVGQGEVGDRAWRLLQLAIEKAAWRLLQLAQ